MVANSGPLLLSLKYPNYPKYRGYSQLSKCLFCLVLRKHHVMQNQENYLSYTLMHLDAHTMHEKSSSTAFTYIHIYTLYIYAFLYFSFVYFQFYFLLFYFLFLFIYLFVLFYVLDIYAILFAN